MGWRRRGADAVCCTRSRRCGPRSRARNGAQDGPGRAAGGQQDEGCFVEVKGKVKFDIKKADLKIPPKEIMLPEDEIRAAIKQIGLKVVAGTVGEDEHSV